jgi:hypothetical protein
MLFAVVVGISTHLVNNYLLNVSFIIPQASKLKHPMDTIITNDQKTASIIQVLHSGDNVSATMVSTSAAMIASRTTTHNTMLSVVGLFVVFICLYVLLVVIAL